MFTLLLVLTPISLLDSTSVVPLCIVPMTIMLGGQRPILTSMMFIAGIFVTYFPFGIVLLFGIDTIFDTVSEFVTHKWQNPDTLDLILQIIIGMIMVIFGYRIANKRESQGDKGASGGMTPVQAFTLGAVFNLTGMYGALPYFAGIDQILRADMEPLFMILAVLYYNLIFVLPLIAFIVLRQALGERADRLFQAVTRFLLKWGRRLIIILLFALGSVLIVDGIGWFLGMPLIPV